MTSENTTNNQTPTDNDLTLQDGRKVKAFSTAGESYTIESQEESNRAAKLEIETQIEEIKLNALKRGIRRVKL